MNRPARLALPTLLVLLWTLVVAPFAVARCDHGNGDIHLHAIGAACDDDADGESDHTDCRAIAGEKAVVGADIAQVPPTPLAPAPHPPFIALFPAVYEAARIPFAQAPPGFASRLRPGNGFSPLLI